MQEEIRNAQGEKIDYAYHPASPDSQDRILLIGHGVTGNKDRPWIEQFANSVAADTGIPVVRFSFSGNGESEGSFEESTISKEVGDLGSVIDAVKKAGYGEIIYVGHSMGGAVGVIRAASDDRINRLVSLAGMVHTNLFLEVEFGDVIPDAGYMWEDEDCPLSTTFAEDMREIDDVLDKAPAIHVPWLLVHGDEDDVVPIDQSREIFGKANEPKKLVELPGVDHVFSDAGLQPMIQAVTSWLKG